MNEYPFTETPMERLQERLDELRNLQSIAHGELRSSSISREIAHLIFELNGRMYGFIELVHPEGQGEES